MEGRDLKEMNQRWISSWISIAGAVALVIFAIVWMLC